MPGANWHRDTTFVIEEGSGVGSVVDPRGLAWMDARGRALYVADRGKNWVQKLYDQGFNQGYYQLDGVSSGTPFVDPLDVAVDRAGYVYALDAGNRRVLRYDPDQNFIQRVDIEPDASGRPLADPVAVAADDSLVYVGDPAHAQVVRYKRRK
jgi:sugar lactone lactonase YvrE